MKILKKIKNFFKKNKNSTVVLKEKNRKVARKRKSFKINLEFLKKLDHFKWKYIPYFLIFLIAFILIVIWLVVWPFFRVEIIEITRKDNITNMDITYRSLDSLRWEKMFNVNETFVIEKLRNYQDNIKSINLSLRLPKTLLIRIESYKELYNVIINDNTFLLLENWVLIPSTHSKTLRLLDIRADIDKNKFVEYKQIFSPNFISRINFIVKRFEENFINVTIKDLFYYEAERELHIWLEDWTLILFSINNAEEIESQIERLAIFNKDYDWINRGLFSYLDLRIKNKVFYCPIEIKTQCDLNLNWIYNN